MSVGGSDRVFAIVAGDRKICVVKRTICVVEEDSCCQEDDCVVKRTIRVVKRTICVVKRRFLDAVATWQSGSSIEG